MGLRMPAIFVGHGSPMNGIENNAFAENWRDMATKIPRPKAILCISAHWETRGTRVTSMPLPRTIHDFGGFPEELYRLQYPAPGSAELARMVQGMLKGIPVILDSQWGLDHGTWIVLRRMYPGADIPVVQLSLDYEKSPQEHYSLAKKLSPLRDKGILLIGSGNIVHNLGIMTLDKDEYPWARTFDTTVATLIKEGSHAKLIDYPTIPHADLAMPTNEHYLPLLYMLAVQQKWDKISFSAEQIVMGSVGMRSVLFS